MSDGDHAQAAVNGRERYRSRPSLALDLAWLVAHAATFVALYLGEWLGRTPCTLCWYQRIALFPLALMLGIACLHNDYRVGRYASPLSFASAAVALYHTLLYTGVVTAPVISCSQSGPSCTDRASEAVAGVPLPMLSLACFAAITVLLALAYRTRPTPSTGDPSS